MSAYINMKKFIGIDIGGTKCAVVLENDIKDACNVLIKSFKQKGKLLAC